MLLFAFHQTLPFPVDNGAAEVRKEHSGFPIEKGSAQAKRGSMARLEISVYVAVQTARFTMGHAVVKNAVVLFISRIVRYRLLAAQYIDVGHHSVVSGIASRPRRIHV